MPWSMPKCVKAPGSENTFSSLVEGAKQQFTAAKMAPDRLKSRPEKEKGRELA